MSLRLLKNRISRTGDALESAFAALQQNPPVAFVNWTGAIRKAGDVHAEPVRPLGRRGFARGPVRVPARTLLEGLVLNSLSRTDKLAQLVRLDHQKVPVPPYSFGSRMGWYPRTRFHQQGRDFTSRIPPEEVDFWVQRVPTTEEWRLHIFKTKKGNYRLLRSGKKVQKSPNAHPWVRAHRLGWKISYIGGAPTAAVNAARQAMEALQLDFGAVDVGVKGDGSAVVFEVNTCPGLDTGTLSMYVDQFVERVS